MWQVILLSLILLLLGGISVLSANNKNYFNRKYSKQWWKMPTKKFWTIIPLNLLVVILSVIQFLLNENTIKKEKENAAIQALRRDSALSAQYESRSLQLRIQYDSSLLEMKNKFDSSQNVTTVLIADNLGKYGYKLDSTGNVLKKVISDSAKTKVILPQDPVLFVTGIDYLFDRDNEHHFKIIFKSGSAGSSNFKIKGHLFSLGNNGYLKFVKTVELYFDESQIDPAMNVAKTFSISNNLDSEKVMVFLKGSYKNVDGSKPYEINTLYYYNMKGRNMGTYLGEVKRQAEALIPK